MKMFALLTAVAILIAMSAAATIKPSTLASNGFELGRTARATRSHQQQRSVVDQVSLPEKVDMGETPNSGVHSARPIGES